MPYSARADNILRGQVSERRASGRILVSTDSFAGRYTVEHSGWHSLVAFAFALVATCELLEALLRALRTGAGVAQMRLFGSVFA